MRTFGEYQEMTNEALLPMLESLGNIPERLLAAMNYSLNAGGKRLRPILLLAACDMAGGLMSTALPFAGAVEMIHTYSLIHDDLPAMDNDDLRRGKPTNHKAFGEGMAILAGDGLLNAAMELMARTACHLGDLRGVRALETIARHAGVGGMIAGQALDLMNEGKTPDEEMVKVIHCRKTADLFQAPVEAGLILAGADDAAVRAGSMYAYHLGLAFQITDDLLDVEGDASVMGKNTGMDTDKMTWVAVRGLEAAHADARAHVDSAVEALNDLIYEHSFFVDLAKGILNRVK